MYDIIIIGAGTAGLTAALYANRAGKKILIIEKGIQGGQIINTPNIENYPALDNISGFDFVTSLFEQAVTKFSTKLVYEEITELSLSTDVKIINTTKNTYECKSVIIAAGATHKELNCPGESKLKGHGVSYCATCDGAFFRDKNVAVIGGGNTALQEARYLAGNCKNVYIIHQRESFRAATIEVDATLIHQNVTPVFDSHIEEIIGDSVVTAVTLCDSKGVCKRFELDGIFVAIGLAPGSADFSKAGIKTDDDGYIIATEDCKTNISGVFVAGDIRTKAVRQLVTAAADGAVSAQMAIEFI